MSKIDLLPCPFCGSDNIAIFKSKSIDGLFAAECIKCNVSTAFYVNENFAAEAWNTRASCWIPCSKRMPDEPGIHVLVTDGIHIMESWYEVINGEILWVDNYTMYVNIKFGEVTHWMPLPSVS